MRALGTALALLLLSSTVVACSSASAEDDGATASASQELRQRDDDFPEDPVEPPVRPPSQPCKSLRFDIYRSGDQACQMPPPAPGGTWTIEPLFPQAPAGVKDRFCAYTWTPTGNTPSCAPAPWATIPRNQWEQIGARGHCPLTQAGCGPTVIPNRTTLPPTWIKDLSTASFVTAERSRDTKAAAIFEKSAAPALTSPTEPALRSGLGTHTSPLGGPGCCDACAEVAGDYTFVVLPANQTYREVYFDVSYTGAEGVSTQRVTVNNPATNVIQVGLDPSRQYAQGMIWAIHMR